MAAFLWPFSQVMAEERVEGRRSLVLENDKARLVLDIAGGSIPEFRFNDSELNPLNWGSRNPGEAALFEVPNDICFFEQTINTSNSRTHVLAGFTQ